MANLSNNSICLILILVKISYWPTDSGIQNHYTKADTVPAKYKCDTKTLSAPSQKYMLMYAWRTFMSAIANNPDTDLMYPLSQSSQTVAVLLAVFNTMRGTNDNLIRETILSNYHVTLKLNVNVGISAYKMSNCNLKINGCTWVDSLTLDLTATYNQVIYTICFWFSYYHHISVISNQWLSNSHSRHTEYL